MNLAFARFEGQFFGKYSREFKKKQKHSEFASLIKLFYSLRSILAPFSACDLRLFRLHSLKNCFSESLGANFGDVARRHSLGLCLLSGLLVLCHLLLFEFRETFLFLGTILCLSLRSPLYGENIAFKCDIFLLA